jgi:hypothetical protein
MVGVEQATKAQMGEIDLLSLFNLIARWGCTGHENADGRGIALLFL